MLRAVPRWKFQGERPGALVAAGTEGSAAVADTRGAVTLLDARGQAVWTRTHEQPLRAIRVPSDGRGAFVLTAEEVVRYGSTGKAIWRVAPPAFPVDIAIRGNGTGVAVSGGEGLVSLHSSSGRAIRTRRLFHAADYLALSERSSDVVVASARGDVSLLGADGQPAWHLNVGCAVSRPDVSPERIAVPSFDGVYAFLPDGSPAGLYDVQAPTTLAAFGAGGKTLLVGDTRQRLLLLDVASGETLWHVTLPVEPKAVAFGPDGATLAVLSPAGEVEVLHLGDDRAAVAAPSRARAPGRDTLQFLEVGGAGMVSMKVEPRSRWRVRVPDLAGAVRIAVLKGGAGVAMLDVERGALSFWTGGNAPAWSASGLGPDARIAVPPTGHPLVAAGANGVRFFTAARGEIARADLPARALAIADSGLAVLVGSDASRLHLFDGSGRPVWDVPTGGFSRIGISPRGMEVAVAQPDGRVYFQVRGAGKGFATDLTPETSVSGLARPVAPPAVDYRPLSPFRAPDVELEMAVLDDGLAFGTRTGRAGFVAPDGTMLLEAVLPDRAPVEEVTRVGHEVLLRDATGRWFRLVRPGRAGAPGEGSLAEVVSTRNAPRGARSLFAASMDRLLEFRYDSKEIGCMDAVGGDRLWRRGLDEMPRAVAVTVDGSFLAALVAGELVLYDLSPAEPAAAEAAPRYLEL